MPNKNSGNSFLFLKPRNVIWSINGWSISYLTNKRVTIIGVNFLGKWPENRYTQPKVKHFILFNFLLWLWWPCARPIQILLWSVAIHPGISISAKRSIQSTLHSNCLLRTVREGDDDDVAGLPPNSPLPYQPPAIRINMRDPRNEIQRLFLSFLRSFFLPFDDNNILLGGTGN